MLPLLGFLFAAYILGSTPTSYWIGKGLYGVDLRNEGSGNLGATNTYRVLGWKAAIPVFVVDVLKGWFPVWWFPRLAGTGDASWAIAFGAAAVLGHVFSFWVGFRGGKGVATSAGVLAALAPWSVAAGFGVWVIVILVTRMVSAGSMAAAVAAPVAAAFTADVPRSVTAFLALLGLFILWAHRSNIRRILAGTEARLGRRPHSEEVPGGAS
ncbi:MAG: glycerol-3-phosphate 1-O-acyltransferase PlsY [Gemmatimonadetes bacterium]|nr:glycerol-3-phosphate 1-O-acyltransferase PlsY [Gemmatimonadota bacterium]